MQMRNRQSYLVTQRRKDIANNMANYITGIADNVSSYFTPLKPTTTKQLPLANDDATVRPGEQRLEGVFDEGWLSSDLEALDQSTPVSTMKVTKRQRTPTTNYIKYR